MSTFVNPKCPNCNIDLNVRDEWDKEFDRLDDNIPAGDIIADMLASRNIAKYECPDCSYTKLTD